MNYVSPVIATLIYVIDIRSPAFANRVALRLYAGSQQTSLDIEAQLVSFTGRIANRGQTVCAYSNASVGLFSKKSNNAKFAKKCSLYRENWMPDNTATSNSGPTNPNRPRNPRPDLKRGREAAEAQGL